MQWYINEISKFEKIKWAERIGQWRVKKSEKAETVFPLPIWQMTCSSNMSEQELGMALAIHSLKSPSIYRNL